MVSLPFNLIEAAVYCFYGLYTLAWEWYMPEQVFCVLVVLSSIFKQYVSHFIARVLYFIDRLTLQKLDTSQTICAMPKYSPSKRN